MAGLRRPEDFDVWQLCWELKRRVYAFTATEPARADRSYCDDVRRAARSTHQNISEGFYRFNPGEFRRFLNDAKASLGEVRDQLLHARSEHFLSESEFQELSRLTNRAIGAATRLQAYLLTCPPDFWKRLRRKARKNEPPDKPKIPNQEPGT